MRSEYMQMSLSDIYNDVFSSMQERKSKLIALLEKHIDLDKYIPVSFSCHFYKNCGRNHIYHLKSLLWFLILKKLFGLPHFSQMITILNCSEELRLFCGFNKVPDLSQITRFCLNYCDDISVMFDRLVDITAPICKEINSKKSKYLLFDTTGIEVKVSENNPKFLNSKLKECKAYSKSNPSSNPYTAVYNRLPDHSQANPDVKQQYLNGHYCYALKAAFITDGSGIIRHISLFDNDFKKTHPDVVIPKSDNPDSDKEISDSSSLKPVLSDFFAAHKNLKFSTFIGDAAFDSYDNYTLLHETFDFERVAIPLNQRNSKKSSQNLDENGVPVCPETNEKFTFLGECKGKNRSLRFKWVCSKSIRVKGSSNRICVCDNPCTDSEYGKCTYTYPHKNFRLYPGIPRGTEHWNNLYKHRVYVERTICLFKDVFASADFTSVNTRSIKADLFLSGITQLLGVILAKEIHKLNLCKSIRKLLAA